MGALPLEIASPDDRALVAVAPLSVSAIILDPATAASPAFAAEWDALTARVGDPNPFYERWALMPSLELSDRASEVEIVAVRSCGDLIGLLPLARSTSNYGHPLPHVRSWLHANLFCAVPPIATGFEGEFWIGALSWLDSEARGVLFAHFPALPADSTCLAALRRVTHAQHRPAAIVHRGERALLASRLSPEAYFEQSLSGKKRKELRRQHTRLAELGALRFERREDAVGVAGWADAFLALEAAGWKGRAGSALASTPATAAFFRRALAGAAEAGRLERLTLSLDGRPIAMLANFITPPGAYSFKTAFDEDYARFSPGVLLQRENLALLARDGIEWADSCAAADHPMIERIWREKREIVHVSVAIGGKIRRALGAAILRAETGTAAREI